MKIYSIEDDPCIRRVSSDQVEVLGRDRKATEEHRLEVFPIADEPAPEITNDVMRAHARERLNARLCGDAVVGEKVNIPLKLPQNIQHMQEPDGAGVAGWIWNHAIDNKHAARIRGDGRNRRARIRTQCAIKLASSFRLHATPCSANSARCNTSA